MHRRCRGDADRRCCLRSAHVNAIAGQAALRHDRRGRRSGEGRRGRGIVTAPIHKEAMAARRHPLSRPYRNPGRLWRRCRARRDDARERGHSHGSGHDPHLAGRGDRPGGFRGADGARSGWRTKAEGARDCIPARGGRRSQSACRRRRPLRRRRDPDHRGRRSRRRTPKVSTPAAPGLATPSSCRPARAASTSSSRSITIRA